MQNEKNFQSKNLTLNLFYDDQLAPSQELLSLLDQTLEILGEKSSLLLKKHFKGAEMNLNLISDEEMQELNLEHRQKDRTTDVISFPLQENVRRGEFDEFEGHLEMGDIFVAAGVCLRQAKENELSFEQEFVHLFTHGFLHLCGYDHEESQEEDKLMRQLEGQVMEELANRRK